MLPIHTAAGFSETMAKAYGLGPKQQLKLENLILDAYSTAGISADDSTTWNKAAPTIDDIWALFIAQEKVEEDSLYAALSKLARFKIFETISEKMTSLYELTEGITIIELAGYPSEIQNLVVALTLDLFYSQMQKRGKPEINGDFRQITKMILVDEADNFMSQNFSSLRKILKEGREYGVGVVLSTQDITHFKTGENNYAAYVLTWVIHRVAEIRNADIKAIFNIDDKNEQDNLMETIRKLEKHYSLYIDGEKKLTKMRDKAFWEISFDNC
jgi:DNA phosphorothioation-dependent restriction protein DptH